ncbi:alpha-N-acetylgalactosaminidase-like [Gigantopelta aegis]|uniref:alpha-N-acetylgalactosaminidase-like n=1 Tax=Gigantopelta aegis TaxID=1735272 RepID=UPI001B88D633|nr:alpha-N-acetylgalactosaminidase-like [Gigantopelta aegis]
MMLFWLILLAGFSLTASLDNGLALTPPMGWLTWERFGCNTDCEHDPKNCIGENLIKAMAHEMVDGGYLEAGYQYVCIDDCWPSKERDSEGRLVPDPKRFPNGMKALANYVHALGLKFGIYEDFGTKTCGGYPGSEFYLQTDANTFAEWGVDLLKFDGCHSNPKDMDAGYEAMSLYLNKTGRPILFSCEWPLYQSGSMTPDYDAIRRTCNMWRDYGDINDSWDSVLNTIGIVAANKFNQSSYAGPGGWNDPDMLVVGDFGLSPDQEKTQFAMWAMFAAPLLMSNDLRSISSVSRELLLNTRIIAVNQDKLGVQGTLLIELSNIQIWNRPILPKGSYAIVVLNRGEGGSAARISVKGQQLGLNDPKGYALVNVFDGSSMGYLTPTGSLELSINPTGVVMFTVTLKQDTTLHFVRYNKT